MRSSPEKPVVTDPDPGMRARIWKRIQDIRFCVLNTVTMSDEITSRPLTTQEASDTGGLLFFVPADGGLAQLVGRQSYVTVTYADTGDNFFAALRGRATLSRDPAKARQLWSKLNEAWFPDGPSDPNLMLLHVAVEQVEYWDSGSSKLLQFLTMAKAAVTGSPPTEIGEHGTFRP